jgi:hypothetical protein
MRILIDECVDERLRNFFPNHACQTARYAGLAGLKNGELLESAEMAKFDVFLTVDQGIEYQQNLAARTIAVIILRAKSNRLKDLLPLMPDCLRHIESIQPGQSSLWLRLGRLQHTFNTFPGAAPFGFKGAGFEFSFGS